MSDHKKNYTGPFLIMVGLMFIVGFLTVVNQQFQTPLQSALLSDAGDLKNTLATFITFAFFMGYPALGSTASKWADTIGYKGTLIRGMIVLMAGLGIEALSAYAAGALGSVNIGSAVVPQAFFIFLVGSFVLGSALAIMQTVINPFAAIMAVPGTSAVTRLSIAGSANSIGTTIAPYFVTFVVFGKGVIPEVAQLLLPLSILILVVGIVTGVVGKLHLPNPEHAEEVDPVKLVKSIWSFTHLKLGVVAIFVYVGVEVAVGSNITMFAKSIGLPEEKYTIMTMMVWGGMLVGRLLGSFLSKISGNHQLLFTSTISLILVAISMITENLWFLAGVGLMHSIMWGAIFSLAIDKLGPYTAKGSGALMIGVAGGAIIPWVQGIAADVLGGWSLTWIIVIIGEAYLIYYALSGYKVNKEELA
ncbi:MAG: MFS transporter [Bacteroidota bacterium]